ncbi:MAG: response regulator [Patescibacteria group bacterium]
MKKKILVVDNDVAMRSLVATCLRKADYETTEVESGELAQMELGKADHGISLVVTDMQMPKMNGAQLSRWIMDNHQHIPVVLMTAYVPGAWVPNQEVSECGARLLNKPFMPQALQDLVNVLLATAT